MGGLIAPLFCSIGLGRLAWSGCSDYWSGSKENVIGTRILYRHAEVAENGVEIWKSLQAAYTPIAGYSFLVFNLLCAPCFAAIGAIHREMGDIKWTWRAIGYQCSLAYAVSFVVYQFGHVMFENGKFGIGLILAAFVLLR